MKLEMTHLSSLIKTNFMLRNLSNGAICCWGSRQTGAKWVTRWIVDVFSDKRNELLIVCDVGGGVNR